MCSLRTVGYTPEGKPIRDDEGPSAARIPGFRGALIVGAHGPVEQGRLQSVAHRKAKRAASEAET
jgi:hypothetical protein